MSLRISRLLILTAVVLAISVAAQAQTHEAPSQAKVFSAVLGDKVIALPAPEGFEEVTSQFETMKARFNAIEAPDADMLGGYLPASDCQILRGGQTPAFTYYAKVSVLRTVRNEVFSTAAFAETVDVFQKNSQTLLDPSSDYLEKTMKHVEQELTKLDSKETKMVVNETKNLGVIESRPNVYSVLMLLNLNFDVGGKQSQIPLLASLTFMRVKDRLLYVVAYRKYQSKTDAATLSQLSRKWNEIILAAN